ncbi:MAG: V-type ATP synthase subunit E family protein [bacterium]
MGAGELLDKIRQDGRERVAGVEAEREREAAEVARRRDSELGELERQFGERIGRETGLIAERARSRGGLDRRKAILTAKWEVIDRAFDRARERILADDEYPALLETIVAQYRDRKPEVRLSRVDRERFGARFGARLGEPADISGGLHVVFDRHVVDYSLDEALSALRDELASAIAGQLFAGAASPDR